MWSAQYCGWREMLEVILQWNILKREREKEYLQHGKIFKSSRVARLLLFGRETKVGTRSIALPAEKESPLQLLLYPSENSGHELCSRTILTHCAPPTLNLSAFDCFTGLDVIPYALKWQILLDVDNAHENKTHCPLKTPKNVKS